MKYLISILIILFTCGCNSITDEQKTQIKEQVVPLIADAVKDQINK